MSDELSVTDWIDQLRNADPDAARRLWERYCRDLVRLARQKLAGSPRRVADEEDIALSAFDSFCRGVERGRFPLLHDRDGLWRLLLTITERKAIDQKAYLGRARRRAEVGESAVAGAGAAASGAAFEQVAGREPSPEFVAEVAEECRRLIDRLPTVPLRQVALWKLEGYDNGEIAAKFGCSRRAVERKMALIRSLWEGEEAS